MQASSIIKMKLIKNIPLMAFGFGLGLMITMMSFKVQKAQSLDLLFGYDESNPTAPWTPVPTPGYECVDSENICTYTFPDNAPPINDGEDSTPRSAGTAVEDSFGNYRFVGK